ncbi:MAG: hypothetical protein J6D39_03810 [Niameybacter sp.]|nr:hypothetical protein [Niameybacter sp.]
MSKINETKKELWLSRIMACRQSGLPDVRWCKENNINPSTLYYWIKKLRFEAPEVATKNQEISVPYQQDVVPLRVHEAKAPISHTSSQTAIIIHTGSLTLEIQNGACQETITNTLNALRYLC